MSYDISLVDPVTRTTLLAKERTTWLAEHMRLVVLVSSN